MRTGGRAYILGAALSYILVIAVFLLLYLRGYIYSAAEVFTPYNISIYAGITAYVVFLSQLILSARVRWIENLFGQDTLLRMHGFLGVALFGALAVHGTVKLLMVGSSVQTLLGIIAAGIYIVLAPLAVLVLQGRIAWREGSPPYEGVKISHNLFVAAALAATVHVQLAGSTYSPLLRAITLGWAALCLGAYIRHKYIRPRRAPLFAVERVDLRPNDLVAITLTSSGAEIPRLAGQFAYFRFVSGAVEPEEHPFTLACAPGEPVKIIVRRSGNYTRTLTEAKPGDTVRVDGPYGRFTPGKDSGRPLCLIAGGIGITPMLSMIADPGIRAARPISLLLSARDPGELSAIPELEAWRGDIHLVTFFTGAGESFHGVDTETIEAFVPGEQRKTADVFLCGPPGFMDSMTRLLTDAGVPRRNIRSERFSLAIGGTGYPVVSFIPNYEPGKNTLIGQGLQVPQDVGLMIVEPPGRTCLYFSGDSNSRESF